MATTETEALELSREDVGDLTVRAQAYRDELRDLTRAGLEDSPLADQLRQARAGLLAAVARQKERDQEADREGWRAREAREAELKARADADAKRMEAAAAWLVEHGGGEVEEVYAAAEQAGHAGGVLTVAIERLGWKTAGPFAGGVKILQAPRSR